MKLSRLQKDLRKRIIEISYEKYFSHIGSCLTAVDLIEAVYQLKKKNEKFVLSGGHAAVALYAVLERRGFELDMNDVCVHPNRGGMIDVSTGSLGQGLPIAVGMALANRRRNVYCEMTDSECGEGSIWEAVRIAEEQNLTNLKMVVNFNGYTALTKLKPAPIIKRFEGFGLKVIKVNGHNISQIKKALKKTYKSGPHVVFAKTKVDQFDFLNGLDAHYHVMNEKEYKKAMEILEK